jgi:hypothetical protein
VSEPTDYQPNDDGDGMELVMPFVVCQSKGGPYDDSAFAAGWQAGAIDQALQVAASGPAVTLRYPMVHAALVPQLELIGMKHGWPKFEAVSTADGWCEVTFTRER